MHHSANHEVSNGGQRRVHRGRRAGLLTAATVLAAGLLAACGGGSGGDPPGVASLDEGAATTTGNESATGGETTDDPEEAGLAFAKCMREHGIDMPDPEVGELIFEQGKGDFDPESDEYHAAEQECQPLLEAAIGALEVDPEQLAENRERLLEYARCMRDHGIDMPDPVFSGDGSGPMPQNNPKGADDEFQAVSQECRAR